MYEWRIKFILKSGYCIEGIYKGPEKNSNDIAKRFLEGKDNTFNGLRGLEGVHNILVNNTEVAAIDISQNDGIGEFVE